MSAHAARFAPTVLKSRSKATFLAECTGGVTAELLWKRLVACRSVRSECSFPLLIGVLGIENN